MTDEELIARLRGACYLAFDDGTNDYGTAPNAADRIEALRAERNKWEAAHTEACKQWQNEYRICADALTSAEAEVSALQAEIVTLKEREEKLRELLRESRADLEHYVTHEYPKHLHPYYERQWNRDMELCRRIDAALTTETDNDRT